MEQQQTKNCYFCTTNTKEVDFKDVQTLQRFTSSYAKILPKKRTGLCARHQRKLAEAVKRARYMALIPYTVK